MNSRYKWSKQMDEEFRNGSDRKERTPAPKAIRIIAILLSTVIVSGLALVICVILAKIGWWVLSL